MPKCSISRRPCSSISHQKILDGLQTPMQNRIMGATTNHAGAHKLRGRRISRPDGQSDRHLPLLRALFVRTRGHRSRASLPTLRYAPTESSRGALTSWPRSPVLSPRSRCGMRRVAAALHSHSLPAAWEQRKRPGTACARGARTRRAFASAQAGLPCDACLPRVHLRAGHARYGRPQQQHPSPRNA